MSTADVLARVRLVIAQVYTERGPASHQVLSVRATPGRRLIRVTRMIVWLNLVPYKSLKRQLRSGRPRSLGRGRHAAQ